MAAVNIAAKIIRFIYFFFSLLSWSQFFRCCFAVSFDPGDGTDFDLTLHFRFNDLLLGVKSL